MGDYNTYQKLVLTNSTTDGSHEALCELGPFQTQYNNRVGDHSSNCCYRSAPLFHYHRRVIHLDIKSW